MQRCFFGSNIMLVLVNVAWCINTQCFCDVDAQIVIMHPGLVHQYIMSLLWQQHH
jgi:hypothetical protein